MAAFTTSWTELSGEKNWANLLDPLNEDLRTYVIHYGERSQAIMDGFNGEEVSANYGQSRYPMETLFSKVGLDYSPFKYEVTKYISASNFLIGSYWIGYVAVANNDGVKQLGRRDILVVWRGTATTPEAILDYKDTLVTDADILNGAGSDAMVHLGWAILYTAVKEQVRAEVKRLVDLYQSEKLSITVTGHSMGAALATLNAVDLCTNNYNQPSDSSKDACLVTAFPFASPKVGNEAFKTFFNTRENLRCLRIINAIDMVPQVPPIRFYHVGQQLMVDSRQSSYLKDIRAAGIGGFIMMAHDLEVYLHLVAGTEGIDGGFDLKNRRSIALLNKDGDILATNKAKENHIPAGWWVLEKKAMVQQEDGSWVLDDAPKAPSKMKTRISK